MRHLQQLLLVLSASGLMSASSLEAQVTTATLVGQLRDSSGAMIPGATVVARHEGTGVAREAISEPTVKGHVTNILTKLGAVDRMQAVIIALKRGLIHL
jgi:Bacterial regulatory proteins, luxR family